MRISAKLGLTALVAALLLAAAVGAAGARSLSVSSQTIRATWSRLEFNEEAIGLSLRCPVTLEASFHSRTIAKVSRALIGAITRASFFTERCTGGSFRSKPPFPWHLTYESFTGTLPNITSVRLLLARFRFLFIIPGLATCEYGTSTDNMIFSAALNASGEITSLAPVAGSNRAHKTEPSTAFCPNELGIVGAEGVVTALNSTARIRLTLI